MRPRRKYKKDDLQLKMKFYHLASLISLLGVITPRTTDASHLVSGSTARLPMSLSSVINDLEAEGASRVTTVAFLTSRGITKTKRSILLKSLFGIVSNNDDEEEDEENMLSDATTAFGKRMGLEQEEGDEDHEDEDDQDGIAVANPLPNASVNEVASTVLACGGNIVYVVSSEDLSREEGLFDRLTPALERILNEEGGKEVHEQSIKNLVVVVEGAATTQDLMDAKSKLENAAASALGRIVQPDSNHKVTALQQVFDAVEFVASSGPVDELIEDIGSFCSPDEAMKNVAKSVFQDAQSNTIADLNQSPLDLVAARKMLPLSRQTLADCISSVESKTDGELVPDFGAFCDASVANAMEQFDSMAGEKLLKGSSVAMQIRADLYDQLYEELGVIHAQQLELLYTSSFGLFKSNLSKLRLGPNLASDMEQAAAGVVQMFADSSKKLVTKKGNTVSWANASGIGSNLKKELKEYITLRLQAARADGKYKPLPRKGVTLGFHWLLPKPFGNDYRQEPWQVHAKDDLVYVPKDKITDVRKEDILNGDWRESIVPCPTANEMMYLK